MEMSLLHASPFITAYACFLAVLLGLVAGSFLNCAAIRLVTGEKISRGRSHCMSCGHVLSAADLVPLFSWLFLKGKCRYCGEKVSARYPLSELISAVVFTALLFRFDISLRLVEFLALSAVLLCISFADLEGYIIPDILIIIGLVIRVIFIVLSEQPGPEALQSLIGALSISLPLLLIVLVAEKIMKKEAMGGGDIKLFFMAGSFFNWKENLLAAIFACIIGIVLGAAAMKKRGESKPFPFGPAISAGFFLCMLCGREIVNAYMALF